MAKSSSMKPTTFSKVVISAKRGANKLEVFRGYGIYSRRGICLEAYADDFQYALGRLQVLNNPGPPSGKLRLVRVVAVVEKLDAREIQQICRKAKHKGDRKNAVPENVRGVRCALCPPNV
jgi:hypothetical protein